MCKMIEDILTDAKLNWQRSKLAFKDRVLYYVNEGPIPNWVLRRIAFEYPDYSITISNHQFLIHISKPALPKPF